ncbi:MAG: isoprenoid biosynthesis glyoxalase ElbB [Aquaspirillum sp.]
MTSSALPVAVVLSGSGVYDGSELTEAVSLIVALSQAGLDVAFFAPNRPQMHVINHAQGQVAEESRNILTESARIARGKIHALDELDVANYAAIVMPGGFGAVKNFTDFLTAGDKAQLADDIGQVLRQALQSKKPVVALCAAPLAVAIAARDVGLSNVQLTLGDCEYPDMVKAAASWGIPHVVTAVDQACVDHNNAIITAPAYMYGDATPAQVFTAAQQAVHALVKLLS